MAQASLKVQGSPGEFVISGCLDPTPTPCTKKILAGFVRFAWTPLGSSGVFRPLDPPGQLTANQQREHIWPSNVGGQGHIVLIFVTTIFCAV